MPRQTKMQKMKGLWNASIALGCVLLVGLGIYGLGTINPVTSAQSNDSRLTVQGIDNIVQYLKEMEIYDPHDPTKKVVIGWDDTLKGVVIKGDVNMESIVVRAPGDANTAPNTNKAQSSTVIGGTGNRVEVSTDADTNKNLAIVAGAGNSINNAGNAFVAGGSSVRVQNASNAAVVAASESSIAGDQPKGQVAIIAGNKNTIDGAAINNTVIFAGEGNSTSASNTVLIGKNIHARNNQNIFAWSDGDQSFNPTHPNAFYVNATHGNLGVNTTNPQVKADINGPLGIKTYELAALPSINPAWRGTMVTVSKHGKTGLCGWDGAKWVPLSLSAKQFAVCVQDVNMPPLPANTISNGKTKLPPLWNPAGNGAWETPQWTYHQRLGDGEYRCNKGYHIGNADPDGKVVAKNCVACSPIANQHEWTSDGKNNDCAFTCKASFKHNASARTCTACADGTYTTAGNTDSTCKNCTGLPANAHWTSNGTSETSCSWACNPGYYNTGTACVKLEWKRDTQGTTQCKVGGIMYEAVNTKHARCMAGENQVDESHCLNAGLRKPSSVTTTVYGAHCNTDRKCKLGSVDCDVVGRCENKYSEQVTCKYRRYKEDNTKEEATHSETIKCGRTCEVGQCGTANASNHSSLYSESPSLCSGLKNSVGQFTSHAGTYLKAWTWNCNAKDENTSCFAHKPQPQAGQCGNTVNSCASGTAETNNALTNGTRWKCKGVDGGPHSRCTLCNSGYHPNTNNQETAQCEANTRSCSISNGQGQQTWSNGSWGACTVVSCNDGYRNENNSSCVSKCTDGYQYIPGSTLHNGYCAKWKCESTSSATAGSCSGNYNGWEGKCTGRGRYSSICSGETMQFEGACKKLCYHNNQASECQNNEIGVCQWNAKECVNFDQASCTANTQHGCTRTPGSSSTTHQLKCVKADGSKATGCKDTWTKPQCPPVSNPPQNNSGGQTTPTTQNRKITLSTVEDILSSPSGRPNIYADLGSVALKMKNVIIEQVGSDRYDLIIPVGDNQQFRSAYGQAMVVNGAYNQHHDQYKDIGLQGIIIRATVNMHNPVNGESCLPWLRFNLTSQFNTSSHTASSEYIDGSWGYNSDANNAGQCTSKEYPSHYPRLISL